MDTTNTQPQGAVIPQSVDQTPVWNPPGDGFSLDDLFPVDPASQAPSQPQTPAVAEPQLPAPPAVTPPSGPFIQTQTGTVYRTPEDAVKGIEEKDRIIAQFRQQVMQLQGIDPIKQPITSPNANPNEATFKKLVAAAEKGDANEYMNTIAQFQDQRLSQYAPLLAEVARERAVRSLEPAVPAIRQFLSSPTYQETLQAFPRLAQAIQASEADPNMADQLGELYQIAATAAQGRRVPELVRTAATQPVAQTLNPRPTLQPSTPTPQVVTNVQPDLSTAAGRKAIIERFESAGGRDRVF